MPLRHADRGYQACKMSKCCAGSLPAANALEDGSIAAWVPDRVQSVEL